MVCRWRFRRTNTPTACTADLHSQAEGVTPAWHHALEEKIGQGVVAEVLSAVYQADALDWSFGFRPERSVHKALRVVHGTVMVARVSCIVECNIWNSCGEPD